MNHSGKIVPSERGLETKAPKSPLRRVRSGVYSVSEFSRRLQALNEQHSELKTEASPRVAGATLEALEEAWEELSVANEELQVQSEELSEAHEWLIEERRRYRELFDFAPEPYLVTDLNGKIREINRAAEELLGPLAGRLTDRYMTSLVSLRDRSVVRAQMELLPGSTSMRRWECTLATVPPRVVSMTLSADGTRGMLWALRDITEQRHQQELLQSLNHELERRILARTEELESSRRVIEGLFQAERQARQQLEDQARERETLLALVSHELRSPLHAVLSWAQLMQDSASVDEMRQALGVIERNARTMATLVDDLLDRASLLQVQRPLVKRRVDLPALLGRVSLSLEPARREAGIRFERHAEAVELDVLGDAPRLEQVFLNLLSNAFKFTPGGGLVEVKLRAHEAHVEVRVRDSGQGIGEEQLPHVFNHFYQGATASRPTAGSLGLGLAVVRRLVEAHGGTVEVSSPGEGLGSTFLVRLPLAPSSGAL